MLIPIPFDNTSIDIRVPDASAVYLSSYPEAQGNAEQLVLNAIRSPIDSPGLKTALARRQNEKIVVVVSDITRPVPYKDFLPAVINEIESAGTDKDDIIILIATGMHRPSTAKEREFLFGDLSSNYDIRDHDAKGELEALPGLSYSKSKIFLNKCFVSAGFRIITGLVEPHFMAGFSGGRKAVCPGLASLQTIQSFHGYDFLNSPYSANATLEGNPCHAEALSIARLAGVDFSINLVLGKKKQIITAFAGDLESSHKRACMFVREHACPVIYNESDIVLTGCGGYPLDATFYQCVKGIVAAVPAVKRGGMIIAAGGCREGMGSKEFKEIMFKHSRDYKGFLSYIHSSKSVLKDQWQFQMQAKALEKVGYDGLVFFSGHLDADESKNLGAACHKISNPSRPAELQLLIDSLVSSGKSLSVMPEGPYCTPVAGD